MRTKSLSVLFGIFLVIMMVFGLLPSCDGGQPTSTDGSQTTAIGEIYNWRYQSTALAGTPTYWLEEEFCAVVKQATNNRMNLDLQPQGAIVGSMEIFDAVATGAIETGNS